MRELVGILVYHVSSELVQSIFKYGDVHNTILTPSRAERLT